MSGAWSTYESVAPELILGRGHSQLSHFNPIIFYFWLRKKTKVHGVESNIDCFTNRHTAVLIGYICDQRANGRTHGYPAISLA